MVVLAPLIAVEIDRCLDFVEAFSGRGELFQSFERQGFRTEHFEVKDDPQQDITTFVGFFDLAQKVLAIKEGGGAVARPALRVVGVDVVFCASPHRREPARQSKSSTGSPGPKFMLVSNGWLIVWRFEEAAAARSSISPD